MSGIPATVVLDVQNVYGLSGDVLGSRKKPTPEGVAAALAPYGFDVDTIDTPIGVPDAADLPRVVEGLRRAAEMVSGVDATLMDVHAPPASGDITRACTRLTAAHTALCGTVTNGHLASTLASVNGLTETAVYELGGAVLALGDAIHHLRVDADRRSSVPSESLLALDAAWEQRARLRTAQRSVQALSSYAWAGRNNLAHRDALLASADGPAVVVLPGRFRPGYEGRDPDEKQIDTLCAVACLERTQEAVASGTPRAVVVMSDDDDLTPALVAAAQLTDGTDIRVVVVGTAVTSGRFLRMPIGPGRPRWVVLDEHAWHRALGLDPVKTACTRHQLARLALGKQLPFASSPDGDRFAATPQGLRVQMTAGVGALPAVLGLDHLEWRSGRGKPSHVPRAVVGMGAAESPGAAVVCTPPQSTRLSPGRLPVTDPAGGPGILHVRLPAPGWWMAGDELVIARPDAGGGDSWRVVGPNQPRTFEDLAGAERGRVMRMTVGRTVPGAATAGRAMWATVKLAGRLASVLVPDGMGLHVGNEVAVVPYERTSSGPPIRAVLVSSAL